MRKRILLYLLACCVTFFLLPPVPAASAETETHTYASLLMEAESGCVLRETCGETALPIGSLTKLMTVCLAAEALESGQYQAETMFTAPPSAQQQHGAVIWLTAGEKMSICDLLRGVIIGNANDAAVTLACNLAGSEAAFTAEMNAEAFALGMRDTIFADCTGISPQNRSTAHDLARLCRKLPDFEFLPPIFTTWRTFLRGGKTELVCENTLTRTYEGIFGLKAGHGADSGYTLCAAAETGGMRCIAVILGCDDSDERFTYGKNLLRLGASEYRVSRPISVRNFSAPSPSAAVLPLPLPFKQTACSAPPSKTAVPSPASSSSPPTRKHPSEKDSRSAKPRFTARMLCFMKFPSAPPRPSRNAASEMPLQNFWGICSIRRLKFSENSKK